MKEAPSKFEEENNCKNINVGGRQLNNTFPKKNYVIKRISDKNTENKTEKKTTKKIISFNTQFLNILILKIKKIRLEKKQIFVQF